MGYKRLFIWVEGNDDQRFFENLIVPILGKIYDLVEIIRYAQLKREKIQNFLKSIESMECCDYIYVVDINSSLCVTAKKQELKNKLGNINENRIIVVIKEIESWYLAGLDDASAQKLGFPRYNNTNHLIKEQFNISSEKKFIFRIDCMLEILKHFSVEMARRKNKSFDYFCKKYIP